MQDQLRLLSRPVAVEWAGWRTNTATLQRAGWQLATQYDTCNDRYMLLMRHPQMNLTAITDSLRIRTVSPGVMATNDDLMPVFQVRHIAPALMCMQVTMPDWRDFMAIDAQPQYTNKPIVTIDDTNVFAPFVARTEEVLLNRADMTVIEHLEAIKRLQDPEQSKIRQRMLAESERPEATAPQRNVVVQLVEYRNKAA